MSCLRQFSDLESLFHNFKKKAAGEEATYTAHLSKNFPHGLLLTSLEPGTTDQQYPLTTIIDTGASKVMISKSFATAMGLDLNNLNDRAEFVMDSGVVEHSLGSTKAKVMFTLSRGTANECKAAINATIVDTSAYDAVLGMEFITAMGGAYDTWTELFKYRWLGADGAIHSHEISAPCHTKTPPIIAYACFGGLINY